MDIRLSIGDYAEYYKKLNTKVLNLGLDTSKFSVDHFCYRTATLADYDQKKKELLKVSQKFLENVHHGRPISKFILIKPLVVDSQTVKVVELPSPKQGVLYQNGLEHFEFVVGDGFNQFIKKYQELWDGSDDSGKYNQPVFIKFKEGVVKFHEKSILEVIKSEGNVFTTI